MTYSEYNFEELTHEELLEIAKTMAALVDLQKYTIEEMTKALDQSTTALRSGNKLMEDVISLFEE